MSILKVMDIPMSEIDVDDDFNCRDGAITPFDIKELAEDIQREGLISPGVVAPISKPNSDYKYRLISGFRRHLALKILKWEKYPCVVKEGLSEADAIFMNLNENIQRKNLDILQEAKAIQKIIIKYGMSSRKECAEKLGKTEGWIQIRSMLLDLPHEIQLEVVNNIITQKQIRQLYTILIHESKEKCIETAKIMKLAKQTGHKPRTKKKNNINTIRVRKPEEIFEMMEDINSSIPYSIEGKVSLWPKTLAWAAGQIPDSDLFDCCKKYAEQNNLTWVLPTSYTGE